MLHVCDAPRRTGSSRTSPSGPLDSLAGEAVSPPPPSVISSPLRKYSSPLSILIDSGGQPAHVVFAGVASAGAGRDPREFERDRFGAGWRHPSPSCRRTTNRAPRVPRPRKQRSGRACRGHEHQHERQAAAMVSAHIPATARKEALIPPTRPSFCPPRNVVLSNQPHRHPSIADSGPEKYQMSESTYPTDMEPNGYGRDILALCAGPGSSTLHDPRRRGGQRRTGRATTVRAATGDGESRGQPPGTARPTQGRPREDLVTFGCHRVNIL